MLGPRTCAYLDRCHVRQYLVKLMQQEETRCHTLSTRDCITFAGRSTDQLEILLGQLGVFRAVFFLRVHREDNRLQGVFLWRGWFQILDQLKRGINVIMFQVVEGQVQSSLRKNVYQG